MDVLHALLHAAVEGRPAEVEPGHARLEQQRALADVVRAATDERREVGAVEAQRLALGCGEQVEDRRHDVDERRLRGDAARLARRVADQERDADRRVEEEVAVARLGRVAEALAVVGGEDDDELLHEARNLELVEQPTEVLVGEVELLEVGVARERVGRRRLARLRQELLGRLVGEVRVEEVDPVEEGRLLGELRDLLQREVGLLVGAPLGDAEADARVTLGRRVVVVEALVDPVHRVEHEGADRRGRPQPRLQDFCQRERPWAAGASVLVDAVRIPGRGRSAASGAGSVIGATVGVVEAQLCAARRSSWA
jgi:hypothetical protein